VKNPAPEELNPGVRRKSSNQFPGHDSLQKKTEENPDPHVLKRWRQVTSERA
jgi:hypothetical protein